MSVGSVCVFIVSGVVNLSSKKVVARSVGENEHEEILRPYAKECELLCWCSTSNVSPVRHALLEQMTRHILCYVTTVSVKLCTIA
jgi:hypothetical protein